MPITPPSVLSSTSVISLLPIAKMNCIVSNANVKATIGRTFFIKGHLLFSIQIYIPKGIKINILALISLKSIVPLSSKDP